MKLCIYTIQEIVSKSIKDNISRQSINSIKIIDCMQQEASRSSKFQTQLCQGSMMASTLQIYRFYDKVGSTSIPNQSKEGVDIHLLEEATMRVVNFPVTLLFDCQIVELPNNGFS